MERMDICIADGDDGALAETLPLQTCKRSAGFFDCLAPKERRAAKHCCRDMPWPSIKSRREWLADQRITLAAVLDASDEEIAEFGHLKP